MLSYMLPLARATNHRSIRCFFPKTREVLTSVASSSLQLKWLRVGSCPGRHVDQSPHRLASVGDERHGFHHC